MEKLATLPTEAAEEALAFPNKYVYPEFAGWRGERYLKKLLRQILPMALYRTWEIFADHQAIGNECYLSVTHLAEIAGRTMRTMEKNLASLCAKQLLVERAERKIFRSSTGVVKSKVVIIKDFTRLYALAHEYHEWLNADEYIAADREMIAFMEQFPDLVAKLRRFDNYRKILYNRLPGPFSQVREEDRWFAEYQPEQYFSVTEHEPTEEAKQPQRDAIPAKDPRKHLANNVAKGSTKRITKPNTQNRQVGDSFDSASSSSSENLLKDEEHLETSGGQQQRIFPIPLERPTPEKQEETLSLPVSSTVASPAQKGYLHSLVRKPESEEAQGDAMRASQGRATTRGRYGSCSDDDQKTPSQLLASAFVRAIAAPFGDLNPKGTHTHILSIMKNARLDQPADVLFCLIRAYMVARDTHAIRPEHCHPETGQANRTPLFCAMFQRFVNARAQESGWDTSTWQQIKEEIAADDYLTNWWNEHESLMGEVHFPLFGEQGETAYPADTRYPEKNQEMVFQRDNAPSHRARIFHLSQTNEQREARAVSARSVIRHLLRMAVPIQGPTVLWEHVTCGCPLYHQYQGKEVCALCFPDPNWSGEVLSLLHSIVKMDTAISHEDEKAGEAEGHARDWDNKN